MRETQNRPYKPTLRYLTLLLLTGASNATRIIVHFQSTEPDKSINDASYKLCEYLLGWSECVYACMILSTTSSSFICLSGEAKWHVLTFGMNASLLYNTLLSLGLPFILSLPAIEISINIFLATGLLAGVLPFIHQYACHRWQTMLTQDSSMSAPWLKMAWLNTTVMMTTFFLAQPEFRTLAVGTGVTAAASITVAVLTKYFSVSRFSKYCLSLIERETGDELQHSASTYNLQAHNRDPLLPNPPRPKSCLSSMITEMRAILRTPIRGDYVEEEAQQQHVFP